MSRRCDICGKTSSAGNRITRSGSPKYKGGIGLHTGGITKRRFYPNVQRIRVFVNGQVLRMRVCSRCLKAGKVQRPPARPSQLKAAAEKEARRLAEDAAAAAAAQAAAEAAEAEAAREQEEEPAEVASAPQDSEEPSGSRGAGAAETPPQEQPPAEKAPETAPEEERK